MGTMVKKYSFNGSVLAIELESGKTYQAFMGGLFGEKYAAFFGFLVGEIEHRIAGDLERCYKLDGLTWRDMWAIKDTLVERIRNEDFIK